MDSSQAQTWNDLDAMPRAHRIFVGNFVELAHKLRVLDDPGQSLPLMAQGSAELQPYLEEVERLFHNYLAAAYTLSASIFQIAKRRWPLGTSERAAYEAGNPFRQSGLSAFVFGLRNIAQHHTVPLAFGNTSVRRNPDETFTMSQSMTLDRDALLRLDWRDAQAGRQYLDDLEGNPDIRMVIETFTRSAVMFTAWVYDQIAEDIALLPQHERGAAGRWRAGCMKIVAAIPEA